MAATQPLGEVARAALATCFGRARIDEIAPIPRGASAGLVLRVTTGGRRYLLRGEGPRSPLRYPGQYEALRLAAEAGLAPHVYHLDDTAGVLITDFIEARPLELYPGGRAALVLAVSVLLRRLHDGPVPPAFVPYIDIVDRLFAHVRRSGLFAAGVLDRHAERLQWRAQTTRSSRMAPVPVTTTRCHPTSSSTAGGSG